MKKMAWKMLLTVLAVLITQALAAYQAGSHLWSEEEYNAVFSPEDRAGISECYFVRDQEDRTLVQHVIRFPFIQEQLFVFIAPIQKMCINPGQQYSYEKCECVYVEGNRFPLVPLGLPRSDPGNSTNRPAEKCKDLAGLKYDADKARYVSSSYASMKGATAEFARMTERVQGGTDSGFALRLSDGPILMQAFAGNDFQGIWQAILRVRPSSLSGGRMLLLTDDCDDNVDDKERQEPSLVLAMDGATLSVFLRFKNDSKTEQCSVSSSDWYEIVITSQGSSVTGTVNAQACFEIASPGAPLAMTECALYVGGDPLGDAKQNFDGFLDKFTFVKNFDTCVKDD